MRIRRRAAIGFAICAAVFAINLVESASPLRTIGLAGAAIGMAAFAIAAFLHRNGDARA